MKSVIGESCLRSRFRAAESSICKLRAFAVKASNGGFAKSLKKEDTRCRILAYFRYEIRYIPKIVE